MPHTSVSEEFDQRHEQMRLTSVTLTLRGLAFGADSRSLEGLRTLFITARKDYEVGSPISNDGLSRAACGAVLVEARLSIGVNSALMRQAKVLL